MEYWSVEKKDINPLPITPILQYSNAPTLIEFGYRSKNFD
jgi:hypothetical protein